jgi:quercetin dioxygenase-like cupin family protein
MTFPNSGASSHLPSLGTALAMAKINQLAAHGPGLFSKILFETAEIRLILVAMEPEVVLSNRFGGAVSIQSLSGTLSIRVRRDCHQLDAGAVLTLAPTTTHAIEADEDVMFLLTMTASGLWLTEPDGPYLS